MGWNEGYRILEATIVGAYDLGKLDEALLRVLMEPYRNTDIDHGGSRDLTAKDGLMCDEIIVKLLRPREFEEAQRVRGTGQYWDVLSNAWYELTTREFQYW